MMVFPAISSILAFVHRIRPTVVLCQVGMNQVAISCAKLTHFTLQQNLVRAVFHADRQFCRSFFIRVIHCSLLALVPFDVDDISLRFAYWILTETNSTSNGISYLTHRILCNRVI